MNLAGAPGYHREVAMRVVIVMGALRQHGAHWTDRH